MNFKKVTAIATSLILTAGLLAGCGKKDDTTSSTTNQTGEVYVAEYITPNLDENDNLYDSQIIGNTLYTTNYLYSDDDSSTISINSYDIETGSASTSYQINSGLAQFIDISENIPSHDNVEDFYAGLSLSGFKVLEDGSIITIINHYIYLGEDSTQTDYYRLTFDKNGNPTSAESLNLDDGSTYYSNILLSSAGDFFYTDDSGNLFIEKANGDSKKIHVTDNWINNIVELDGQILVLYYDSSYTSVLSSINVDAGALGKTYSNLPASFDSAYGAGEGNLYLKSSEKLYNYNLESETSEEILAWLDSDIAGNNVSLIIPGQDGSIYVAIVDWDNNSSDLARLVKKDRSEISEKTEIVLASLYSDSALSSAVIDYNKSQDKVHVSIVNYYDWESGKEYEDAINDMNAAILEGKSIDIVNLGEGMDPYTLNKQNLLEDLTPYLAGSQKINTDDYFENLLSFYNFGGKLVAIPYTFSLNTIVGNKNIVGNKEGWTYSELINFAKEHPASSLSDYPTRSVTMMYLLQYTLKDFVNRETGVCNLDSPEFKELLEYLASLPEEIDRSDTNYSNVAENLSTGDQLLYFAYLYDANEIQLTEAMLNNEATYIGYPSLDGSPRSVITPNGALAITASSANKDAAWDFYEFYMNRTPGWDSFGISANKKMFEASIAEDLAKAGEKSGSGFSTGDWTYDYHYVTQEEVDTFYKLISIADPADASLTECYNIIYEEAEGYFKGQKSLDEVVNIIQSRVSIYIAENQ